MGEGLIADLHAIHVLGIANETGVADLEKILAVFGKLVRQERIATDEVVVLGDDLPVGSSQCQDRVHQVHHARTASTRLHAVDSLGHPLCINIDRDVLSGFPGELVEVDVLGISTHAADGHRKRNLLGCLDRTVVIF